MAKLDCVPLTEVRRKSEVVIGGTFDEIFDVHVKCPLFSSVVFFIVVTRGGETFTWCFSVSIRDLPE